MSGSSLIIAQITDIHIGFDRDAAENEFNFRRLRKVCDHLVSQQLQPEILILSGDLADGGDPACYSRLKRVVDELPFPVYPMVGNHDARHVFSKIFSGYENEDGFIQYAIALDGLRVLCLDTLEQGRHGGAFCEQRAAWLKRELDAHSDTPTLLVLHHPPIVSGIDWMDPNAGEPWYQRFRRTIAERRQIVGIACGHLHRPVMAQVEGIPLVVTPAVAPAVSLDFRPVDPDRPDDREIVSAEPPFYSLHRWAAGELVTHLQPIGDWPALARYGDKEQPMMRGLLAERE